MQKKWNEKQDNKLTELFKEGLNNKEIAEQLNRTYDSVAHRISIMKEAKLLGERHKQLNPEESYYRQSNKTIDKFYNSKPDGITKENYEIIKEIDKLNKLQLTPTSRKNYIERLVKLGKWLKDKSFQNVSFEEIKTYLVEIKESIPKSYATHKSTLTYLFKQIQKETPTEEIMKINAYLGEKDRGVKNKRQQNGSSEKKPYLTRKEVVALISGIKGKDKIAIRDRAFLSTLYNSGGRVSELLSVPQRNTITNKKVPVVYFEESKTDKRDSCMLDFCMPYLTEWIQIHEFWNNPEAPLFYSFASGYYGHSLTYAAARDILKNALRISKINKKITLHSLRHTKTHHLVEEGVTAQEANVLMGWRETSQMFLHYSALARDEVRKKELERAGKLTPEEIEARKIERNAFRLKKCARCGTETTPDQFVCSKCGLALNKLVAEIEIKKEKESKDRLESVENKMDLIIKLMGKKPDREKVEAELKARGVE